VCVCVCACVCSLQPKARQGDFTVPTIQKPHMFAVLPAALRRRCQACSRPAAARQIKSAERELWLHADSAAMRAEWVAAINNVKAGGCRRA
jgi:hypothetical protein